MDENEALAEARHLIEDSQNWSRISHEIYTPELAAALDGLSDGGVDTGETVEFWGAHPTDEDETSWRVHLDRGRY